jgi:hypothetical protein
MRYFFGHLNLMDYDFNSHLCISTQYYASLPSISWDKIDLEPPLLTSLNSSEGKSAEPWTPSPSSASGNVHQVCIKIFIIHFG